VDTRRKTFAQASPEDGVLAVNLTFDLMGGDDEVLDEEDKEDDDNNDDEEPPEVRDPNTQSYAYRGFVFKH
jgi:hypothetical protein